MLSLLFWQSLSHHHKRYKKPRGSFDAGSGSYYENGISGTVTSESRSYEHDKIKICEMLNSTELKYLGIPDTTKEDLNRTSRLFNILGDYNIFISFVAICSYNHQCNKNTSQSDNDHFRAAGFLNLKGNDLYSNFQQMVKDPNVLPLGAPLIDEKYPWTSAIYIWNSNYISDFCRDNPNIIKVAKQLIPVEDEGKLQKIYDDLNEMIRIKEFDRRKLACS
ncbi:hypothetical protein TVAG_364410 [Trichomonas vaginalis G3]|uniref:Uncharacterized protein n=1 Tax=Trichomonas vaginalis (strain ATCC PRA-98 / G3) TaxID=412133 RepID=A2E9F2_TRIV3|nr:family protein, putative-related family [Trichomonas vaginalis G3]EAY10716.1 hypothetical protein TVAG_364410 [Trichomonas vaginalis G3]KAI5538609.1 family protein, putative-related family [Trichomonas vaginalis G3]|eukprot:XP_001322939.1 hypothetical protein [Trichomonas vaginalis G3]